MVSVLWLCVVIVFGATVSEVCAYDAPSDLSTEESFIVHATEISNILQSLVFLVKASAENEGRVLNLPEIKLPLDLESSTLEELFDLFERSCKSFRAKFFKFIKKEFESIDPMEEMVCATLPEGTEYAVECKSTTSGSPDQIVTVVELDPKSAEEVEDNYLESDVNFYDGSTFYTVADVDVVDVDHESAEALAEESERNIEDSASEDQNSPASSKSKDNVSDTSHEATTEQILEQFLEEVSNFGEGTLEPNVKLDLSDSERFSDRSGDLAHEHPLNFRITPVPGVRGTDFPDYEYIPQTSFTCEDKEFIPGFYADLDVDCQVFHVCWPDRVESFLCPSGTQFNQEILTCDYWFNVTCSHTPDYYSVNAHLAQIPKSEPSVTLDSAGGEDSDEDHQTLALLGYGMKVMPVQFSVTHSKDTFSAETSEPKVTSTTEYVETSLPVTEDMIRKMYEELYNADRKSKDAEQLVVNVQPKKQRSNAKFFRTKLDRSGPVPKTLSESGEVHVETPVTTESSLADISTDSSTESEMPVQTPVSESADVEKVFFVKEKGGKKIYVDKSVIPIILNRLFDTADDVINKNILPFTKEVLVASYSKLHKAKKH